MMSEIFAAVDMTMVYLGSTLIFFRVIVTVDPRCNEGPRDRKYVRYTVVSLYRGSFSHILLLLE